MNITAQKMLPGDRVNAHASNAAAAVVGVIQLPRFSGPSDDIGGQSAAIPA